MPREIAKVLYKEEPHVIYIGLSGEEPTNVTYEREEENEGKKQWIKYKGTFTSRTVIERK